MGAHGPSRGRAGLIKRAVAVAAVIAVLAALGPMAEAIPSPAHFIAGAAVLNICDPQTPCVIALSVGGVTPTDMPLNGVGTFGGIGPHIITCLVIVPDPGNATRHTAHMRWEGLATRYFTIVDLGPGVPYTDLMSWQPSASSGPCGAPTVAESTLSSSSIVIGP